MILLRRTLGGLMLLSTLACQSTPDSHAAPELSARLDASEQRLAAIETTLKAIETKLDAADTRIDPVVEWARAAKISEDERTEHRKDVLERREAREKRREDIRDRLESSDARGEASRAVEGAAEAIECTGFDTPTIECRFDRTLLDDILADPATVARQARIVPSVRDGKATGFKFYGIRPGSIPQLLGLKNGDRLETVNGEALDSVDGALALYTKFRSATTLELGMVRKGAPLSLTIKIEE